MPFIENISYSDVTRGTHRDPGPNSMLIQIVDIHLSECPIPDFAFKHIFKFAFLDAEKGEDVFEEFGIKDEDAKGIADALLLAKSEGCNVVVHCIMGLCRSGAVVECGVQLGFEDTERVRQPNVTVKNAILKQLGLDFDPDESPLNDYRLEPVWE